MEISTVPDDISVVNRSWTDEQRRIVWTLISKARRGLQIEISPIVASAFIILQRYFRSSDDCSYELFILMVAALFTACKAADNFRPIHVVYAELSRICQSAPSMKIRSLLGDRDQGNQLIDPMDLVAITRAELDLLKSIDFNFDIDTPFVHFDKWKQTLMMAMPNEEFIRLCNSVIIDICLMICSSFYLDIPPEVAAAAAAAESANQDILPAETWEWMRKVKEKYGQSLFDLAVDSISREKSRTALIRKWLNLYVYLALNESVSALHNALDITSIRNNITRIMVLCTRRSQSSR